MAKCNQLTYLSFKGLKGDFMKKYITKTFSQPHVHENHVAMSLSRQFSHNVFCSQYKRLTYTHGLFVDWTNSGWGSSSLIVRQFKHYIVDGVRQLSAAAAAAVVYVK